MAGARTRRRGIGGLGCLLLVVLALVGAGWLYVHRNWTGPGPATHPTTVVVPQGATLAAAARELEKVGAVRSTTGFLRLARRFGSSGPIRAGEYEVPAHASARDVLELLQSGRIVQRMVTIPEGMPSVEVFDRIAGEKLLTGTTAVPAEGSVLPGTYAFQRGEPRAALLERMQAAMTRTIDTLWLTRKADTAVDTKEQALTLASIVEKETAVPAERPVVAGVYSNRLRTGMRLQADPTIIYPMTRGRPLGRRIRLSEVRAVNDYNTYAMAGLPKGPITNPGKDAIAAVLAPARTDALYFVADGRGGHVFSATLADQNANVARYYKLQQAQGKR